MNVSIEIGLLVSAFLIFCSILMSKTGYRFGIPTLLMFLLAGMLFGTDGLGIQFDDVSVAQHIGMVALCIILFTGGMDTKMEDIRPVLSPGVMLATSGVFLTTLFCGLFVYWVSGWQLHTGVGFTLIGSLLLAATMSSTDSASVFNILRSQQINLKHNLKPMLELESGSNDPMAYLLTIILIQCLQAGGVSGWEILWSFLLQFVVGIAGGYLLGRLSVWLINRVSLKNAELYSIMVLCFIFIIYCSVYLLKGNGYLAVYIAGMVIGNSRLFKKKEIGTFLDGMTWLLQIVMFLMLGLLVNPHEMLPVMLTAVLVSVFMTFVARPLSVWLSLLPFGRKITNKSKLFISWVGIRGAAPIIFATYPVMAQVDGASQIFNIVFFITLLSLLIQGTSVTHIARLLGVSIKNKKMAKEFEMELPEEVKSVFSEIIVTQDMLIQGDHLIDIPLPDNTLVVLVKRFNHFFVPNGCSQLFPNDKLLIISDNEKELKQVYNTLGIEEFTITKN